MNSAQISDLITVQSLSWNKSIIGTINRHHQTEYINEKGNEMKSSTNDQSSSSDPCDLGVSNNMAHVSKQEKFIDLVDCL